MHSQFDVIIVGAGPIGLACGIAAHERGLSYLIIEKGCLVNSIYHYPANMTFFSTSQKIEIGGIPFVSHHPKPNRSEALEYYRRVADHFSLNIHTYEQVKDVQGQAGNYLVRTSKAAYRSQAVVIATGFYDHANLLNVPGEELSKVTHYYKEAHPYIGKKVLVVGAANSAIDVALETWRKGAEVSLVVRQSEISHRVKYWVRPDIVNRIKEGSIKAYFNSQLLSIGESQVLLHTPEGELELENDFVLAMTGYHPDFRWLASIGIALSDDGLYTPQVNPDTHETNRENIFLAGTVCGGMNTNKLFIENSREHATLVMSQIANRSQKHPA